MATIPDSVQAQITADWSPAGGAEPTYYVEEDIRANPPAGEDFILILSSTLDTDPRPVNDKFTNEAHVLDIIVNTLTSADRLKIISDEIVRILDATAIADITYQRLKRRTILSSIDKGIFNHQERITYDLLQQMKSSAAAYGIGTTSTVLANLLDLTMWGSANAAWVPCIYMTDAGATKEALVHSTVYNAGVSTTYITFTLSVPLLKGSLKLYTNRLMIGLFDADASNYLTSVLVRGINYTGYIDILPTDATDKTTVAQHEYPIVLHNCSVYEQVIVVAQFTGATAAAFEISSVRLQCYYA